MTKESKAQKRLSRAPGGKELSRAMPCAIIARKPRVPVTSGTGDLHHWYLTFAPTGRRWADPLTGWTASDDPLAQIRLRFPDRQSATRFAESQGWNYVVQDQAGLRIRPAPRLPFLAEENAKPICYQSG